LSIYSTEPWANFAPTSHFHVGQDDNFNVLGISLQISAFLMPARIPPSLKCPNSTGCRLTKASTIMNVPSQQRDWGALTAMDGRHGQPKATGTSFAVNKHSDSSLSKPRDRDLTTYSPPISPRHTRQPRNITMAPTTKPSLTTHISKSTSILPTGR
jgi:hypothetical protein